MSGPHRLERRAQALAGALLRSRDALRDGLAAPGERPAFNAQLSTPEAVRFWLDHRHDDLGAAKLATMSAEDILRLDTFLSRHLEQQQFALPEAA
jgi:hypothetical protein